MVLVVITIIIIAVSLSMTCIIALFCCFKRKCHGIEFCYDFKCLCLYCTPGSCRPLKDVHGNVLDASKLFVFVVICSIYE